MDCILSNLFFVLVVKGPAANATDALRLLVQPYDDDDDADYFLSFSY
jgi:hypothetical protein